jgi:hypothetical protein
MENSPKLRTIQLAFREVNDETGENSKYTTFKAEFAVAEGDIIFHFFKTPEIRAWTLDQQRHYWADIFARVLEETVVKYSGCSADSGRLKAQHTYDDEAPYSKEEPLDAWWFRAYGFGHLLDTHKWALRLCEVLDEALDAALAGEANKRT